MVTQGKKFLAAHNHPDPTEYYAPLAKSLSNTQTLNANETPGGSGDANLHNVVNNNVAVSGNDVSGTSKAANGNVFRMRTSSDLILDPLPDLKSNPSRNSYSEQDMETSPDLSLSPNSDYSTGKTCRSILSIYQSANLSIYQPVTYYSVNHYANQSICQSISNSIC